MIAPLNLSINSNFTNSVLMTGVCLSTTLFLYTFTGWRPVGLDHIVLKVRHTAR